jgi:hypothetical protein
VRVGKDQLRMLIMLGSPTMTLITPGKSERGLIARGLLRQDKGGACCITSAGLRVLADEMETGRVTSALDAMCKDAAKRRRAIALKAKAKGHPYDAHALPPADKATP